MDGAIRLARLALALAPGLGPRLAAHLVEALGGVEPVLAASASTFAKLLGARRGPEIRRALDGVKPRRVLAAARALEQRVLVPGDRAWPARRLEALVDPPMALFLRGRLPPAAARTVGVVGTREAGPYGRRHARQLARTLAARGVWIVSGFAMGIDGEAHRGALVEAGGGTLAVLGCGVDVTYPAEHALLGEDIVKHGGLLSEHPPGTRPQKGHFPRRNRLVAALSEVVVVIEAPARSGALVTAQLAVDMGREVLALPGPVGGSFRGSHRLLRQGVAGVCEGPADVFEALGVDAGARADETRNERRPEDGTGLAVFAAVEENEAVGVAELCRRTGRDAGEVAAAIARLEIDGFLARVPGLGVRRL